MSKCVLMTCVVAMVMMEITRVNARLQAHAEHYPACYTDASNWNLNADQHYDDANDCQHPLYTNCRWSTTQHLCCGPDHFCCHNQRSCCRKEEWTVYEIVGVVTGVIAWTAILVILCICVGTRVVNHVRYYFRKRQKKVFPQRA